MTRICTHAIGLDTECFMLLHAFLYVTPPVFRVVEQMVTRARVAVRRYAATSVGSGLSGRSGGGGGDRASRAAGGTSASPAPAQRRDSTAED